VGLYGLDRGPRGLRREVRVVQDAPGDQGRALRVVRRLAHRVRLVQADVVQERRDAQDLRVVEIRSARASSSASAWTRTQWP
jgi:hypothetical protein